MDSGRMAYVGGIFLIALACDHGGFELMREVRSYLAANGFEYKDFGTHSPESCDYPEIAVSAATAVSSGECDRGIFICSTGIGMSIAANKVAGIRAALCTNCFMAEMTRRHNDANVLVLGGRVINASLALEITGLFLRTDFESGGRHSRRVDMLKDLDKNRK